MQPTINEPTVYASNPWKNAVAMLLGEPFELPEHRAVTTHRRPWSMTGRDNGVDLDQMFIDVFGDDTDAMDCQEFDA